MKKWKVTFERNGGLYTSQIIEASSADEAESKALRAVFGNVTYLKIVSVERA
jgi:hypothetical protein